MSTPSLSAANKYGSGAGLAVPGVTSSKVTTVSKGLPIRSWTASSTGSTTAWADPVTSAMGTPASRISVSRSSTPGRHGTSRSRLKVETIVMSWCRTSSAVTDSPISPAIASQTSVIGPPVKLLAFSGSHMIPWEDRIASSASTQRGSVSTRVPSKSHNTAAKRLAVEVCKDVSLGVEIVGLRVMDDEGVGGLFWMELELLRQLHTDPRRVE